MLSEVKLTDFLRNQTFVAFDTETTGLWAPANRIVELGAVKFRLGSEQVEVLSSLINPERTIPKEVIAIHGITDEMVADAPSCKPVLEKFLAFCGEGSILLAHNALFDISFLACELDRAELQFGDNLVLDTVDIFRRLDPALPSYSLLSLARSFGVSQSQQHRALGDAELVYRLFVKASPHFAHVENLEDLKSTFTGYSIASWGGSVKELPPEFGELNRAIKENLRVEITYQTETKPSHQRVIRPRHVYMLGSMFYINAFCERSRAERTFRLDRIGGWRVLP